MQKKKSKRQPDEPPRSTDRQTSFAGRSYSIQNHLGRKLLSTKLASYLVIWSGSYKCNYGSLNVETIGTNPIQTRTSVLDDSAKPWITFSVNTQL